MLKIMAMQFELALDMTIDFTLALTRFAKRVTGRALFMMEMATGHHDVAHDLVQESLMTLYTHYLDRAADEWTPLFYTILNNKLMDWRRREQRKNKLFSLLPKFRGGDDDHEIDPLELIADDKQIDPQDLWASNSNLEQIKSAIGLLPLRQQQAFVLRAWEELDTRTTAQIMQCSEGSVKTHYSRAIAALKQSLTHLQTEDEYETPIRQFQ